MKANQLSLILLFSPCIGFCQEYSEYSGILANSGWCCEQYFGTGAWYTEYTITGSTIINDQVYKIINGKYLLQEDSLSRQVWYLNDGENELLYDFTLELNDTFQIELLDSVDGTYVVSEIDTIETISGKRKRWFLYLTDSLTVDNKAPDRNLIWIEGIGSTYGPVYPQTMPVHDEFGGYGTCLEGVYSRERIQIYQGHCGYIFGYWPDECKFIKSDVPEYKLNPVNASFNAAGDLVLSGESRIVLLNIYDLSGRRILSYSNKSGDKNLIIPNQIETGIYICEIFTDTNERFSVKAIKCFKSP